MAPVTADVALLELTELRELVELRELSSSPAARQPPCRSSPVGANGDANAAELLSSHDALMTLPPGSVGRWATARPRSRGPLGEPPERRAVPDLATARGAAGPAARPRRRRTAGP